MTRQSRVVTGAILALTIGIARSAVTAEELIYGSWMGANASTNEISLPQYFSTIADLTDGSIDWRLVPGGQLASGPGTVDAVAGNLIDAGTMMAPYTPRELPAMNAIFTRTVAGDDIVGAAGAMNELLMLHCPQCQAEFRRNNAVGFGAYNISPYVLMCRPEITTVADLSGVKVRASGGGVAIMTAAGATPVAMNPAEATSALERGVVDCVMGSPAWLRNYGYMDIVSYVLDYPLGMAGPPLLMYLNRDRWNALTPAERKAHIDAAPMLAASGTIDAQIMVDAEVREAAMAQGIRFIEGGDDFGAVMEARLARQEPEIVALAESAGVEDVQGLLDTYRELLEKWSGISQEVGTDTAAFADALEREVFSKVDPENL